MNSYPNQTQSHETVGGTARSIGVLAAVTLAVIVASPHALTAARAVVNLPASAVAVAWGRAHGGSCGIHANLFVTCESMRGGYTNAGTTVGNVWLYGHLDGSARQRHESTHADQWAMFGPAFPALYGADSLRTGGNLQRNVFERSAGLRDGGYVP